MAASEASILSSLHLTADQYAAKYGEEMDLSEKHLAWFAATALPKAEDYPVGEYPYDISQAGEGAYPMPGVGGSVYDFGGNYFLSTGTLASGMGVVKEAIAPYADSNGTPDNEGDWSLPEELRFIQSFELKNANVLPSPATRDGDGNYVYRPAGTEAIKQELLKGRAVGISFCADSSMPDDPQARRGRLISRNEGRNGVALSDLEAYVDLRVGITDDSTLSDEELAQVAGLTVDTVAGEDVRDAFASAQIFCEFGAVRPYDSANMMLMIEDLEKSGFPELSEEEYREASVAELQPQADALGATLFSVSENQVMFAGQLRCGLYITAEISGQKSYSQQIILKQGHYMLTLTLGTYGEAGTSSLIALFYEPDTE